MEKATEGLPGCDGLLRRVHRGGQAHNPSAAVSGQRLFRRRYRKKVIAGVFDNITLSEIPGHFPNSSCLYVSLTEIRGEVDIMLRYVDLSSNEVLLEHGPTKLVCDDPLVSVDFSVEVPPLPVPHEGVFGWEVHAGDEMIGMLRITAVLAEQADEDEEGDGNE
jgi:hypothetical protein